MNIKNLKKRTLDIFIYFILKLSGPFNLFGKITLFYNDTLDRNSLQQSNW